MSANCMWLLWDILYMHLISTDYGLACYFWPGTFEKEGPRDLKDAGKAGLVTIQQQFSVVLGTLLVCKFPHLSQLHTCPR